MRVNVPVRQKMLAVSEAYTRFLKAIADPKPEQHEELLEWIDGRFDPE